MSIASRIIDLMQSKIDGIHSAMPAFVKSYNANTRTATVIVGVLEKDGEETRPEMEIPDVPVWVYGAKKRFVSVPLENGDGGFLLFFDADTEGYRNGGDKPVAVPSTERHDEKDIVFIPGFVPDSQVEAVDSSNIEIRNENGTAKIGNGAFSFTGNTGELIDLLVNITDKLDSFMGIMLAAQYGTYPLDPASTTQLTNLKAQLITQKSNLNGLKL